MFVVFSTFRRTCPTMQRRAEHLTVRRLAQAQARTRRAQSARLIRMSRSKALAENAASTRPSAVARLDRQLAAAQAREAERSRGGKCAGAHHVATCAGRTAAPARVDARRQRRRVAIGAASADHARSENNGKTLRSVPAPTQRGFHHRVRLAMSSTSSSEQAAKPRSCRSTNPGSGLEIFLPAGRRSRCRSSRCCFCGSAASRFTITWCSRSMRLRLRRSVFVAVCAGEASRSSLRWVRARCCSSAAGAHVLPLEGRLCAGLVVGHLAHVLHADLRLHRR